MASYAMLFAGLTAGVFAVMMVLSRSLYTSAVCLLVVLFQAAVLFFFSGAPMLAFLQIMIYAGAVMVLIVIMIMAAGGGQPDEGADLPLPKPLSLAALAIPLVEAGFMLWRRALPIGSIGGALSAQARLGSVLFGPYAVATESVTLLMFLAGLAIIERRTER
jgi:NADH-quinone oxidoreductase subunit J